MQWSPDGGARSDLSSVSLTLGGRGDRTDITHPEAAAQKAHVYSLTPATDVEAGGAPVLIRGSNFFVAGVDDVTDIDFGAVAATVWTTLSDSEIVCTVPAGTGSVNVTVTNATGESTETVAFLYT